MKEYQKWKAKNDEIVEDFQNLMKEIDKVKRKYLLNGEFSVAQDFVELSWTAGSLRDNYAHAMYPKKLGKSDTMSHLKADLERQGNK